MASSGDGLEASQAPRPAHATAGFSLPAGVPQRCDDLDRSKNFHLDRYVLETKGKILDVAREAEAVANEAFLDHGLWRAPSKWAPPAEAWARPGSRAPACLGPRPSRRCATGAAETGGPASAWKRSGGRRPGRGREPPPGSSLKARACQLVSPALGAPGTPRSGQAFRFVGGRQGDASAVRAGRVSPGAGLVGGRFRVSPRRGDCGIAGRGLGLGALAPVGGALDPEDAFGARRSLRALITGFRTIARKEERWLLAEWAAAGTTPAPEGFGSA